MKDKMEEQHNSVEPGDGQAEQPPPDHQETTETSKEEGDGEEVLTALQEALEAAQAKAAEYLDGWQRAQAEFANYKKRQEAERSKMIERANADLLTKLLPVADDFDRALSTMPDHLDHLTWCEGVVMIKHKLEAILDSEGVKAIETEGQPFDPHSHEAVTYEEAAGFEEGQIIGEVQKGYILGERVLRPALVRVAKAPCTPVETEDDSNNSGHSDRSPDDNDE